MAHFILLKTNKEIIRNVKAPSENCLEPEGETTPSFNRIR